MVLLEKGRMRNAFFISNLVKQEKKSFKTIYCVKGNLEFSWLNLVKSIKISGTKEVETNIKRKLY